jgi:hypothetical protein
MTVVLATEVKTPTSGLPYKHCKITYVMVIFILQCLYGRPELFYKICITMTFVILQCLYGRPELFYKICNSGLPYKHCKITNVMVIHIL